MSLISNNIRLPVLMSIVLTLTAGCGENYIPLGGYRIEWDAHDPKLHGQVVHFKVPMRYVLLEEGHIGDYLKEEVAIGRILFESAYIDSDVSAPKENGRIPLESKEAVSIPGATAKQGYLSERIPDGMSFTVTGSYWHRKDWFDRELNGDLRKILFVDENGVESITLFGTLTLYSDRPELGELKNEGRYK